MDARVDAAMGRDTSRWKALNVCAPCLYKLDNEPPLKYSLLVTMDGNQSLKLVDNLFRSGNPLRDDRAGRSSIWLTPEEVDKWKDEVRRQVCLLTQISSIELSFICTGTTH